MSHFAKTAIGLIKLIQYAEFLLPFERNSHHFKLAIWASRLSTHWADNSDHECVTHEFDSDKFLNRPQITIHSYVFFYFLSCTNQNKM